MFAESCLERIVLSWEKWTRKMTSFQTIPEDFWKWFYDTVACDVQRSNFQLYVLLFYFLFWVLGLHKAPKGSYRRAGEGCQFTRPCSDRSRGNVFKLKENRCRSDIRKNFITVKVVRQWERLPRKLCPIPSNNLGQVAQNSEQPDLVEGVPAHGTGVGTRWTLRSPPTQTIGSVNTYSWQRYNKTTKETCS